MDLSPQDLSNLNDAVRSAFTLDHLLRLLTFRLDRELDDITLAPSYVGVVFEVVSSAVREGWIEKLRNVLKAERQDNETFGRVIDGLLSTGDAG